MAILFKGLDNQPARLVILLCSGIGDGDDGATDTLGCLLFVFPVAHIMSLNNCVDEAAIRLLYLYLGDEAI